jgi:hypothetical protein
LALVVLSEVGVAVGKFSLATTVHLIFVPVSCVFGAYVCMRACM